MSADAASVQDRMMFTIFCEDVRAEIGNKVSFMGIYSGQLFVPQLPFIVPRIYMVMRVRTPADRPFTKLKFRIQKNEEVMAEIDLPESELAKSAAAVPVGSAESQYIEVGFNAQLGPIGITEPFLLRARAVTETGEELKGGSLAIALQAPATAPGQP